MEKPGVRAAYVKARMTNGVPIWASRTAGSDRPAAAIATSSTIGPIARRTSRLAVSLVRERAPGEEGDDGERHAGHHDRPTVASGRIREEMRGQREDEHQPERERRPAELGDRAVGRPHRAVEPDAQADRDRDGMATPGRADGSTGRQVARDGRGHAPNPSREGPPRGHPPVRPMRPRHSAARRGPDILAAVYPPCILVMHRSPRGRPCPRHRRASPAPGPSPTSSRRCPARRRGRTWPSTRPGPRRACRAPTRSCRSAARASRSRTSTATCSSTSRPASRSTRPVTRTRRSWPRSRSRPRS